MTDETRTRFLAAIARQIPAERVIEVHLFAGIRQGGTESGVAVIAVEREVAPSLDVDGGYVPAGDVAEAAEVETTQEVIVHDQLEDETAFVADETLPPEPVAAESVVSEAAVGAPVTDAPVEVAAEELLADEGSPYREVVPIERDLHPAPPALRYTVYSARYRSTLKGLDRGKWEVSVTEEADAPLLTIDAVVRGVTRRSGDAEETIRLSGDEFRASLPAPVPV
jgi:hypothetical protein